MLEVCTQDDLFESQLRGIFFFSCFGFFLIVDYRVVQDFDEFLEGQHQKRTKAQQQRPPGPRSPGAFASTLAGSDVRPRATSYKGNAMAEADRARPRVAIFTVLTSLNIDCAPTGIMFPSRRFLMYRESLERRQSQKLEPERASAFGFAC